MESEFLLMKSLWSLNQLFITLNASKSAKLATTVSHLYIQSLSEVKRVFFSIRIDITESKDIYCPCNCKSFLASNERGLEYMGCVNLQEASFLWHLDTLFSLLHTAYIPVTKALHKRSKKQGYISAFIIIQRNILGYQPFFFHMQTLLLSSIVSLSVRKATKSAHFHTWHQPYFSTLHSSLLSLFAFLCVKHTLTHWIMCPAPVMPPVKARSRLRSFRHGHDVAMSSSEHLPNIPIISSVFLHHKLSFFSHRVKYNTSMESCEKGFIWSKTFWSEIVYLFICLFVYCLYPADCLYPASENCLSNWNSFARGRKKYVCIWSTNLPGGQGTDSFTCPFGIWFT